MDLSPLYFPARRETVVLLGAGATRGASFVKPSTLCPPPVDLDFFKVLRSGGFVGDDDARRLLDFVEEEFDSLDVGMETFYSQASQYDTFVGGVPDGNKGRRRNYEWGLKRFRRVLPKLFAKSVGGRRCRHHDRLAAAAQATDTFISFNYDCLIDRALVRQGGRRWDPEASYGVPFGGDLESWKNHEGTGRFPKRPIMLLKPHGSLNWADGPQLSVRSDEYDHEDEHDLKIVPPLWQKSFEEDPYTSIWTKAREALSRTKALLIVGYSLPETDVFTQAALRIDVDNLDFLCVVNPDPRARERILRTLRSAVSVRTHLVLLDRLEYLGDLLPGVDDESLGDGAELGGATV